MLQHFQIHSIFDEKQLPGWVFSFYFKQYRYNGIYHSDGSIEWKSISPDEANIIHVEKQIHELMIYHIYDN